MSESPEALLADTLTLRRRARADRQVHWLPVLFFGLAVAGSAPLHVEHLDVGPGEHPLYSMSTDPRLTSYWTVALLVGALLTAWWYRRAGRRIGVEGRTGPAVVAGSLVVIGLLSLTMASSDISGWTHLPRDHMALLVLAVGLLVLAREERSRELGIIAGLFAAAAVLANTYPVENVAFALGWDPDVADPEQLRFEQLPALVAPAAVLLVGGTVAGLRSRWAR